MADVPIAFTIPGVHVSKIQAALDYRDPGGGTYAQRYTRKIRDWTKAYYKQYQEAALVDPAFDNLTTQTEAAAAITEVPDIITGGF